MEIILGIISGGFPTFIYIQLPIIIIAVIINIKGKLIDLIPTYSWMHCAVVCIRNANWKKVKWLVIIITRSLVFVKNNTRGFRRE